MKTCQYFEVKVRSYAVYRFDLPLKLVRVAVRVARTPSNPRSTFQSQTSSEPIFPARFYGLQMGRNRFLLALRHGRFAAGRIPGS